MFTYNLTFLDSKIMDDILYQTLFEDPDVLDNIKNITIEVTFHDNFNNELYDNFIFVSDVFDDPLFFRSLACSNMFYHYITNNIIDDEIIYYTIKINLIPSYIKGSHSTV